MTHQVRNSYRRHRKTTWGVALALAVAVAAIVIPIATGAPEKTYTMLFPSTGAVTPAPSTTGNTTLLQNLCTDSSYTSVKVELKNTAKTANLGSGNVTFPGNVTLSGTPTIVSGAPTATATRSGNVVSLRQLSLPKGSTVTFSVALSTTTAASPQNITAVIKQSNDFSDSGTNPDANTFTNPTSFPALAVQDCTTTISGKVYLDRNDSTSSTGSGAFGDVPKAWTVNLFQKVSGSYSPTPYKTTTSSGSDGTYTFTGVQKGFDYKVCVVASASDDSSAWGLLHPTGNSECGAISSGSASTSPGNLLSNLLAPATGQDFAVVPATALFSGGDTATTPDGNYSVTAGTTSNKDPAPYAQQTWTGTDGHVYFEFAPLATPSSGQHIYLLENLKGEVAVSVGQTSLQYDDVAPYGDNLVPMPYCQNDPRPAGWPTDQDLATTGILPSGATSCIVEGSQAVVKDSSPAKVSFEYLVYTALDGSRGY
jgi:hypothetical protein